MIRFYGPDVESTGLLPETESAHCSRVLRLKEGDEIYVVDGKGAEFHCRITYAHHKSTEVEILEKRCESKHWTQSITLAVAATKNMDRLEWLAEKAVEIGVDELVFLNCERNVRRIVKRDRLEKIMISAMKQSLKSTLPVLRELQNYNEFVKSERAGFKCFGYCDENSERKEFARTYTGDSDVTIMIGPEGDFTPDEVKIAFEHGYEAVTFGNTRLRTETAALYALCSAHTVQDIK